MAIFTLGDTGGTIERGFMDGRPLIFEFGLVMQEGTPATPGISGDYEKTVQELSRVTVGAVLKTPKILAAAMLRIMR